jgi:hypothetical protein
VGIQPALQESQPWKRRLRPRLVGPFPPVGGGHINRIQADRTIMKKTRTKPLRTALLTNAAFSLTCAALLILSPTSVAGWLGLETAWFLTAIGIGRVLFAVELVHQATRNRLATWRALCASIADFVWVIGSFALLALFPDLFSPGGTALIVGVALAVAGFGGWQLWGIAQAHRLIDCGLYRHCVRVAVDVPADAMWRVIARMDQIQNYMPSLRSSTIRDGKEPGVGAVRVCEDQAGKRWAEECIAFRPGRSFDVRFLCDAPGLPFPATTMRGGWEVVPGNQISSEVSVWWELEPKPKWLVSILLPVLAFQADRDFIRVIERMAKDAVGEESNGPDQIHRGVGTRLIPKLC